LLFDKNGGGFELPEPGGFAKELFDRYDIVCFNCFAILFCNGKCTVILKMTTQICSCLSKRLIIYEAQKKFLNRMMYNFICQK